MKTIPSFDIDHTKLKRGMYISRIDDDVVTYDVRMREPNNGDYLSNEGMHTIEHLYATYVRNTEYDDNIIYVGPMGCRTGFYFLTRNLPHKDALKLTLDAMKFIIDFEGEIPGATLEGCGNYKEHSLSDAKEIAKDFKTVLENWTQEKMRYKYHGI
ncbi:MAG: S-ribosylhomocysteine lyase [Oscillospiraceae bacterium]